MNEIFRFHHEDGEHTHPHEHGHSHSHEGCDPHDCAACGSCDPMQETVALLQYMVNHNAAHANELAQLGRKLTELGNREAGEQVLAAVSEFEKGNLRLSARARFSEIKEGLHMCLSTVYKNTVTPETVAMKNVMKIECQGDMVILTDLMERQMAIHGELVMANLVEGVAVVREAA